MRVSRASSAMPARTGRRVTGVSTRKMTVAIHGSCVTRDAFSREDAQDISVEMYVARHGIVSAMSPPVLGLPTPGAGDLESASWRLRIGHCDAVKRLGQMLAESPADVLLIDLMDDRLPLIPLEGSFVTESAELYEYLESVGSEQRLPTPMSRKLTHKRGFWLEYLERYCDLILAHYRPEQIIIHEAYQVPLYIDLSGRTRPFGPSVLKEIMLVNVSLADKYRALRHKLSGCSRISMTPSTRATETHRWGLAPYHYTEEHNDRLLRCLREYVASRDGLNLVSNTGKCCT